MSRSRLLAVAAATLLPGAAAPLALTAAGWRHGPDDSPAAPPRAVPKLTTVPPGPVTDRGRVELRLAVPNPTRAERRFEVVFYRDKVAPDRLIGRVTTTAPPHGTALARAWWDTAGCPGDNQLLYQVRPGGPLTGGRKVRVVPSRSRALPRFQGLWLDPLALSGGVYPRTREMTERDVRDRIDAFSRLGVTILILTYAEYQGSFFYPSKVRFFDRDLNREAGGERFGFDVVGTVLSEADRQGLHVFLGLGRGGDAGLLWEFDRPGWAERNRRAVGLGRRVARELWDRYAHHPSFYGWYLTHEMNDLARAAAYYDPVADFCHALAPDKPVLVAPAGTPVLDRKSLAASKVDVFAYQDAVGAGYVPYRYTYRPERRLAMLDRLFAGYRAAHEGTGKHLWADLEVWEMDGTAGYSGAYPAAWGRVEQQLRAEAKHVAVVTAYEGFGFLEPPGSGARLRDGRARRLFEQYEAYLKTQPPPD